VSQHEDLGVLGRLLAGQQREPAEELAEDEVQESECHDRQSSWTFSPAAKATGQPDDDVLGTHKLLQRRARPDRPDRTAWRPVAGQVAMTPSTVAW
jgi:hypothetical protein